eukprot:TRINITY_DN14713_c0_g3_i1.p1 TRINITY_DN14713_c0_g3~~TRINITY_DN14713_c0_g3_i1.p1  ORF type:complete len:201 (-),score=25.04 TRINITY_DN14713_c0_g3_i1:181-783(-)
MVCLTVLSQMAVVMLFSRLAKTSQALFISKEAGCGLSELACPGSPIPNSQHSACSEVLQFTDSCEEVQAEIEARIKGQKDRKSSPGSYKFLASEPGRCTKASRTTGPGAQPGPFTDLFGFRFLAGGGGCQVSSCSESQVNSRCDFSTNFCNLFNMYCNKADACEPLLHDLSYTPLEFGDSCNHGMSCGGWENQTSQCTRR